VKPRVNQEPRELAGSVECGGEETRDQETKAGRSAFAFAAANGYGVMWGRGCFGAYSSWVNWDDRSATTYTWTFCRKSMCKLLEIDVEEIGG
jgi:hypothetical protein